MNRQALMPLLYFSTFFLLLFAYTKLAGSLPLSVNSITTTKSDTFSVTGQGIVTVKPDIAKISIGVEANGVTAKAAQEESNSKINAVIAAIKNLGIEEKDIKTSSYNIHPQYDYVSGRSRISGYNANTNLSIKVRVIDKANEIIDAATTAGSNQIGNLVFDVDDRTAAEDEARKEAVSQAKSKAQQAAAAAGFSLGKIINYSESFNDTSPMPLRAVSLEKAENDSTTSLEPGSSEIKVTVTLHYEIR
ncbi:MAG: DUF541 domain-containing protein [Armatimonadetes bacterium]|nr:MAG: DUF541 domain-containing protein [Armatimonadota bacterium]